MGGCFTPPMPTALPPSGAAGGDLGGTFPNPSIAKISGTLASFNGVSLVGNTIPTIVAKADLTGQTTNVGATTLYAVPAGQGGMYRVHAYEVITTAAVTTSVLPNCYAIWTDNDTGVAESGGIAFTNAPSANTVGTQSNAASIYYGVLTINAAQSTNIQFKTLSYASNPANTMQYALHVKLEYLGS